MKWFGKEVKIWTTRNTAFHQNELIMSYISLFPQPPPQIIIKRPLSGRQHETIVSKMSHWRRITLIKKSNTKKVKEWKHDWFGLPVVLLLDTEHQLSSTLAVGFYCQKVTYASHWTLTMHFPPRHAKHSARRAKKLGEVSQIFQNNHLIWFTYTHCDPDIF